MSANDRQVGGTHYASASGFQHWDAMAAMFGAVWFIGCATKYGSRHTKKKGREDLEKAAHYLEKLAEVAQVQAGLFSLLPEEGATRSICSAFLRDNHEIPGDDHGMLYAIFMIHDETTLADARAAVAAALEHWYPEAPAEGEEAGVGTVAAILPWQRDLDEETHAMLLKAHALGNAVGDFMLETSAFYNAEGAKLQKALNDGLAAAQDLPDGSPEATAAQQRAIAKGQEDEVALNEGFRWLQIARTDLQKGFMALRRAISRPKGF